jgi:hypothetical protein
MIDPRSIAVKEEKREIGNSDMFVSPHGPRAVERQYGGPS